MDPSDFNVALTLDNDSNDNLSTIYYCSYCNTRLHYHSTDEPTGKKIFVCLKCGIEYIPANQLVKRSSRFKNPTGPQKELLTAAWNKDVKASSTHEVWNL